MITTGCEGCCFLQGKDNNRGCAVSQACVVQDGKVVAPGYCRMCRSHTWAKRQGTDDLQQLGSRLIEERSLELDMLVFFDEAHNSLQDLEKTLDGDWYVKFTKKIIIMDVTGFGERQNLALQYMQSREHPVETIVDSSAMHEPVSDRGKTIKRMSSKVKSPFFLAIPAGNAITHFDKFASMIQNLPSRVIHWSFPFVVGSTAMMPYSLDYGLFITKAYRAVMQPPEVESFTDQLRKEEQEMNMGLSWFCSGCFLR